METTRQNKISRLIQKELSEIFLLQTKAMNGVLVSVSAVRISPDMSIQKFSTEKMYNIRFFICQYFSIYFTTLTLFLHCHSRLIIAYGYCIVFKIILFAVSQLLTLILGIAVA